MLLMDETPEVKFPELTYHARTHTPITPALGEIETDRFLGFSGHKPSSRFSERPSQGSKAENGGAARQMSSIQSVRTDT